MCIYSNWHVGGCDSTLQVNIVDTVLILSVGLGFAACTCTSLW